MKSQKKLFGHDFTLLFQNAVCYFWPRLISFFNQNKVQQFFSLKMIQTDLLVFSTPFLYFFIPCFAFAAYDNLKQIIERVKNILSSANLNVVVSKETHAYTHTHTHTESGNYFRHKIRQFDIQMSLRKKKIVISILI